MPYDSPSASRRPPMIPLGYMAKRVARPDGWLKAPHVTQVYSVSSHLAADFGDWINAWMHNGYWFFGRPTLEELRQDLRAVTMKCRPDWDITRPELKAAWQQGSKELFYPYGKTYLQTLDEPD